MRNAGVPLRAEYDDEVRAVMGDFVDLQRVLINLIDNARDAMLEMSRAEKPVMVRVRSLGDQVSLSVTDAGIGLREPEIERLSQPFFTTREGRKGSASISAMSTIQRLGAATRRRYR